MTPKKKFFTFTQAAYVYVRSVWHGQTRQNIYFNVVQFQIFNTSSANLKVAFTRDRNVV